jgi:hypothetical protein
MEAGLRMFSGAAIVGTGLVGRRTVQKKGFPWQSLAVMLFLR